MADELAQAIAAKGQALAKEAHALAGEARCASACAPRGWTRTRSDLGAWGRSQPLGRARSIAPRGEPRPAAVEIAACLDYQAASVPRASRPAPVSARCFSGIRL